MAVWMLVDSELPAESAAGVPGVPVQWGVVVPPRACAHGQGLGSSSALPGPDGLQVGIAAG